MERRCAGRLDLEMRNQRILVLYARHVHRKRIALIMKLQYETVKKVLQRYQSPYHEEIVRPIESYDVGYRHSER